MNFLEALKTCKDNGKVVRPKKWNTEVPGRAVGYQHFTSKFNPEIVINRFIYLDILEEGKINIYNAWPYWDLDDIAFEEWEEIGKWDGTVFQET